MPPFISERAPWNKSTHGEGSATEIEIFRISLVSNQTALARKSSRVSSFAKMPTSSRTKNMHQMFQDWKVEDAVLEKEKEMSKRRWWGGRKEGGKWQNGMLLLVHFCQQLFADDYTEVRSKVNDLCQTLMALWNSLGASYRFKREINYMSLLYSIPWQHFLNNVIVMLKHSVRWSTRQQKWPQVDFRKYLQSY